MIVRSHPLPCLPRASGTRLYARGETSSKCFTRRVETQPHFAMTTTTTTTNLEDLSTSSLEGLYASNLEPRGTGRDFSVMAMPKVRSLMDEAFPESPQRCTGQAATGAVLVCGEQNKTQDRTPKRNITTPRYTWAIWMYGSCDQKTSDLLPTKKLQQKKNRIGNVQGISVVCTGASTT